MILQPLILSALNLSEVRHPQLLPKFPRPCDACDSLPPIRHLDSREVESKVSDWKVTSCVTALKTQIPSVATGPVDPISFAHWYKDSLPHNTGVASQGTSGTHVGDSDTGPEYAVESL